MNIDSCPMLGTPKQNAFICKLAAACGFEVLAEAVNEALGRGASAAIIEPLSPADASKVIEWLLARAQQRGVTLWKSKRSRKGDSSSRRKSSSAKASAASATNTDSRRSETTLADYPPADLAAELERRGLPAELMLANPDLIGGAMALLEAAARAVVAWQAAASGDTSAALGARMKYLREAIENTGASFEQFGG